MIKSKQNRISAKTLLSALGISLIAAACGDEEQANAVDASSVGCEIPPVIDGPDSGAVLDEPEEDAACTDCDSVSADCAEDDTSAACAPCAEGYVDDGDGCVDIDECADANRCAADVSCTNSPGGFACGACPEGYEGDGETCTDIDECTAQLGACSLVPAVTCENLPGSYRCDPCPAGYGGDGKVCLKPFRVIVRGLAAGKTVVLEETTTGSELSVSANRAYDFAAGLPVGSPFSVRVRNQPSLGPDENLPQRCALWHASGEVNPFEFPMELHCGTSCASQHAAHPELTGRVIADIDPDGAGPLASRPATCDMSFGGGGYTLIESIAGPGCTPSVSSSVGSVTPDSCTSLEYNALVAIARMSDGVHVRTASGAAAPSAYATSLTQQVIDNLKDGNLLNAGVDPAQARNQWQLTGLQPGMLDFDNSEGCDQFTYRWPSVYWACRNFDGWHLWDYSARWQFSSASPDVFEVYVR